MCSLGWPWIGYNLNFGLQFWLPSWQLKQITHAYPGLRDNYWTNLGKIHKRSVIWDVHELVTFGGNFNLWAILTKDPACITIHFNSTAAKSIFIWCDKCKFVLLQPVFNMPEWKCLNIISCSGEWHVDCRPSPHHKTGLCFITLVWRKSPLAPMSLDSTACVFPNYKINISLDRLICSSDLGSSGEELYLVLFFLLEKNDFAMSCKTSFYLLAVFYRCPL